MANEHVTGLCCVRCGKRFTPDPLQFTCDDCGLEGTLDVEYDFDRVAQTLTRPGLSQRPLSHWRYLELLPISGRTPLPQLQLGMTPVYEAPRLAQVLGLAALSIKDDGRNPTGSFKDRASSVGVVKAQEAGRHVIACASTGNAASSLAGFSAAVGMQSFIFVPDRAPEPKLAQLLLFGAQVFRVQGSYDLAWELCQAACERYGWYNRNCAVNPYLVEGKKTVGLEVGEQLGSAMPDWVVVSVGDGCTLAGAWKGLQEMHRLGFFPRLPRMLGVQARGSAPITYAWEHRANELIPPASPTTLADSICVGHPRNWRKALRAVRESQGAMVSVEDADILEGMRRTARLAAVFGEPAAAASIAGLTLAVQRGIVSSKESALVLMTGNGLKDVKSAILASSPPIDLLPTPSALERALAERGLL